MMRVKAFSVMFLIFGIGLMWMAGKMLADGKIGVGRNSGPVTEFIEQEEQPARFWRIFAALAAGSVILLLAGAGFLTGVLVSPLQ